MNIPKEAIEKAIEGGWQELNKQNKSFIRMYVEGLLENQQHEVIALDPTFWQALGKSLGWDNPVVPSPVYWTMENMEGRISLLDNWQNAAHTFYDLILTNGDVGAYWKEILK